LPTPSIVTFDHHDWLEASTKNEKEKEVRIRLGVARLLGYGISGL
jgi:hypothetical protein